jgi:hypothetical protein
VDVEPDFWLGDRSESEITDFDGRLRRCFVLGRLAVARDTPPERPLPTQLWVRLDPPLELFDAIYEEVVLQARHVGRDVADLGDQSISVYVSEILSGEAFERGEVQPGALHLLTWADVARDPAFLPETQEEGFDRVFDGLRRHAEREGDANLEPAALVEGSPLGNWVHNIKRSQAEGRLRQDWVRRLESLPGWRWGVDAIRDWEALPTDRVMWLQAPAGGSTMGLDGRLRFCDVIGDRPPVNFDDGRPAVWVYIYPVTNLPADDPGMLVLAARDGDVDVRGITAGPMDVDVAHVRTWRRVEDGTRRPGALQWLGGATIARDPALLPPMTDDEWRRGLAAVREYRRRIGHCWVPFDHVPPEQTDPVLHLGGWVLRIRSEHRHGILPEERARELESVPDWTWAPPGEA